MAGFEVPVRRACLMVSLALVWRLRFRHLGLLTRCWQRWCWSCWSSRWPACRRGSGCRSWRLPCCSGCSPGALGAGAGGRPGGGRSGDGAGAGDAAAGAGPAVEPERAPANLLAVPDRTAGSAPAWREPAAGCPGWARGCFAPLAFRWTCCFVRLACWRAWPRPGSHRRSGLGVALGMLGALCWLAPAGLPLRALGAALLLPALLPSSPPVEWGRAEVRSAGRRPGAGRAGVRTGSMLLLYDSGARQGAFDMGERVVVPVLRSLDLRRLDGLLLSHADNATMQAVLYGRFPIPAGLAGQRRTRAPAFAVVRGQLRRAELVLGWRVFEQWAWAQAGDSNDRSCVLRVEADGEVLLLTGDISRAAEHAWRQAIPGRLVAGAASWQPQFLRSRLRVAYAASPCAGLARLAQRLRPSPWRSDGRYARVAAQVHDTARDGALTFLLGSRGGARGVIRRTSGGKNENRGGRRKGSLC